MTMSKAGIHAMSSSRNFRCVTALVTLFCLLFMQLAVAAYACPGEVPPPMGEASAHAVAGVPPDAASGCAGTDMEQPSLCHAHDQVGNQSLDKPELPQVQPFMAANMVRALALFDAPAATWAANQHKDYSDRTSEPSLAIRHCCFRI